MSPGEVPPSRHWRGRRLGRSPHDHGRRPIPANAYTGLSTCVSIYTAVATRVGKHRVCYQPNISGDWDPSGLQLWVDHVLTKLGPEGIDLDGGNDEASPTPGAIVERPSAGRIVQSPIGGGIEIDYADGTKLVVTPTN